MRRTVQDLQTKIESKMKNSNWMQSENERLGTSKIKLTNWIQKNGRQSQTNDDKTEEINTSVKKNVKFNINPSKRHSGNLRNYVETKSMNNRNRKRRTLAVRYGKYFPQNQTPKNSLN